MKKIFKKEIAMELSNVFGHKIRDAEINNKKPNFVVYLFDDTKELRKDLTFISNRNKSKRSD